MASSNTDSIDLKSVARLDGSNFQVWKFQMRTIFTATGLLKLVEGTETRPAITEAGYDAWNARNARAMCYVSSSMDYKQLETLITCETAAEMWAKLSAIHEQKSAANKLTLMSRFHELKMGPNDTVVQHVARIENMASQLRDVGEELSKVTVMSKILSTLPQKFGPLVTAWDSVSEEQQTQTKLIERLVKEEARLAAMDDVTSTSAAMTAQQRRDKGNQRGAADSRLNVDKVQYNLETKKNIVCYFCKKRGHISRYCFKRKNASKYNKSSENSNVEHCADASAFIVSEAEIITELLDRDTKNTWFLDSGASKHMTFRREWLYDFHEIANDTVSLGDNTLCEIKGYGSIAIKILVNGEWKRGKLEDVLYVPTLRKNLFSTGACTNKGYSVIFHEKSVEIKKSNFLKIRGIQQDNNLYRLLLETITINNVNIVEENAFETWHKRLGHINDKCLRKMIEKKLVTGIKPYSFDKCFCEDCVLGKQHRLPFKHASKRMSKIGDLIHADVCGPMSETSVGGSRYFLVLKDDYSGFRKVYFMQQKNDTYNKFKEFVTEFRNSFGRNVKSLRADNGTEFTNHSMRNFMKDHGIVFQTSAPYTHEQNGTAERDIRTIVECARTMLIASGLPQNLWAEATNTAVYIINRCIQSQSRDTVPYELWFKRKPDLSHVKTFGCVAYAHVPKELTKKWEPKSKKMYLVGYHGESKNYRLFNPLANKVIVSRDVVFNEKTRYVKDEHNISFNIDLNNPSNEINNNGEIEHVNDRDESKSNAAGTNVKYDLRNRDRLKRPDRYEACVALCDEPTTYQDAINGKDSENWTAAINEELEAHERNNTWTIVDLPEGKNIIDYKWVFKRKPMLCEGQETVRFKARLCAKGFSQKPGIDFDEIYSPVVRYDTVRMLLATAAIENLEMRKFDIKTAFINGKVKEELYMKIPRGINVDCNKVCRLNKSIYGLKQAARCWNDRFNDFMKKFNLKRSESDKCVYFGDFEGRKIYLAIYIDDGLVLADSTVVIDHFFTELRSTFEITESDVNSFVGIEIERNRNKRTMFIHQTSYVKRLLKRFGMCEAKSVSIPSDPHVTLKIPEKEWEKIDKIPYREAVGCLLFLAMISRPDISYAVGLVSRFCNQFDLNHWNSIQRIFKYLLSTENYGILYRGYDTTDIKGFSDADYAGDIETRRSTTGYLFQLASGPITWTSKRQATVSLSTTEAEYIAASTAIKECIWLGKILTEIGFRQEKPITLNVDNQSAIRLIKNPEYHNRTKHIDVKFHFIREKYEHRAIDITYVPSHNQLADILTKSIAKERFESLRKNIGIVRLLDCK